MANSAACEPHPLAYDIATACRISSLGRTKLYELISAGNLESRMIGKRRLIIAESLRRLIEEGC
jgi:excisionase family DNA binding protein